MASSIFERARRQRACMEQIESELEITLGRANGGGIHDRAHPIAIHRGKSARVKLDAINHSRIEQADRTQEVLQVERLVKPQAIEHDSSLIRLTPAHRTDAREAVRRHARQTLQSTERLVSEARHVVHLLLREKSLTDYA